MEEKEKEWTLVVMEEDFLLLLRLLLEWTLAVMEQEWALVVMEQVSALGRTCTHCCQT